MKFGYCYEVCIEKQFLINEKLWQEIQNTLSNFSLKATTGRPLLDIKSALNAIYYLLKTGIQWKALPHCFGSASAVHRMFQRLNNIGFFQLFWQNEVLRYDAQHGLNLKVQAGDCAHIKSPLGQDKVGKSPVDRRKHGTKRSIITTKDGIVIGCSLGAANDHDSMLFLDSIKSISHKIQMPYYKEMHLDAAYDDENIKTILFNYYYVPKIVVNPRRKKIVPNKVPEGYVRWFVEGAHSWANRFKRLLVRFEKKAKNYLALMHFAFGINTHNKLRV
jgi:putative transposase